MKTDSMEMSGEGGGLMQEIMFIQRMDRVSGTIDFLEKLKKNERNV